MATAYAPIPQHQSFNINGLAQGTSYHILYFAADSMVSKQEIDSIFDRIDSSLSLYKPYSLVNAFNSSASGAMVDEHLEKVVRKGIDTYKKTRGIFDITVYPLTLAWGFGARKPDSLPTTKQVKQLLQCVGSDKLSFRGRQLLKKKPCVQLDPNGIAQGYSVDRIAGFLQGRGVTNFLVEVGGEIRVQGKKPDGSNMKIAIEVPDPPYGFTLSEKLISISHGAITTSGSYRKYFESGGRLVSHILDARTGRPAVNELLSVTVFAADAITADAYDNALMVMGLKKAMLFVESRPDLAAHFIYRNREGTVVDTASSRFKKLMVIRREE